MSVPPKNIDFICWRPRAMATPRTSFGQEKSGLAAMMRDVLASALPPFITMRPPCRCRKHRRRLDVVAHQIVAHWAVLPRRPIDDVRTHR
jgi:hypothetical protein